MSIESEVILEQALGSAPEFYDIPDEMQAQLEEQVTARERFFWLQATQIKQDVASRALLRRAIYAETRLMDAESRLGEMALICRGAKERIRQLEQQLLDLAGATDQDAGDLKAFGLRGE